MNRREFLGTAAAVVAVRDAQPLNEQERKELEKRMS
jgi:hypothetical protein